MILVAGGTGFIGRAIVEALRRRDLPVRVLSRNPATGGFGADPGVTAVRGDVRDPATLGDAVAGCDAVVVAVQFPGHPVEVPAAGLTYDEYDRKGTRHLVAAAQRAAVRRIVYVSGAGVGEGRPEEWFVAKEGAEQAVRDSGIAWTILRPSWVYGPRDRSLNTFATLARLLPVVPLPGPGTAKVRPVHVDDVGEAVARALERDAAVGRVIGVGGPELLDFRSIVRTLLAVTGRRRLVLPAPIALVKLGAAVLYRLPGRRLSPRAVDFVNGDGDVDVTALREVLDVEPRPLAAGIAHLARRRT